MAMKGSLNKIRILKLCVSCYKTQRVLMNVGDKNILQISKLTRQQRPWGSLPKNYHCNSDSNTSFYPLLYHPSLILLRTRNVNMEKIFFHSCTKRLCVKNGDSDNNFNRFDGTDKKLYDSQKKMTLIMNMLNALDNPSCVTKMPGEKVVKDFKDLTLEKQLMYKMESWKIDEAISLLKDSVTNGAVLDSTVLLNMMLQIAELGKVDHLMELHTILKDKGLITKVNFFQCLAQAFYTSGDIINGMAMLKTNFIDGQDFHDTDALFTLLGTMIIKDFDHHYDLVEEFVETMKSNDPPVLAAKSMLWKCFVLAEKFDKADEMIVQDDELRKLIPPQVTSIIQSSTPVDCDMDKILLWLTKLPYLKDGLKATAYHMFIQRKCDENALEEAMDHLSLAMDSGFKIQHATLTNFLSTFLDKLSNKDLEYWENLLNESNIKR